jgi:hypothetical protein
VSPCAKTGADRAACTRSSGAGIVCVCPVQLPTSLVITTEAVACVLVFLSRCVYASRSAAVCPTIFSSRDRPLYT